MFYFTNAKYFFSHAKITSAKTFFISIYFLEQRAFGCFGELLLDVGGKNDKLLGFQEPLLISTWPGWKSLDLKLF